MDTTTMYRQSTANGEANADSTAPRLAPIEEPDSWWVWLAYKLTEWMQGTVITPVKVIQARLPESLRHAYETQKLEENLVLSADLRTLLKRYVAALNGCSFCIDIAEADAEDHGLDVELLRARTAEGDTAPLRDDERAALEYARAVTENVHVEDDVFAVLRDHFSEREIVEITWLCATENYYNRLNAPLGIGSDDLCSV